MATISNYLVQIKNYANQIIIEMLRGASEIGVIKKILVNVAHDTYHACSSAYFLKLFKIDCQPSFCISIGF